MGNNKESDGRVTILPSDYERNMLKMARRRSNRVRFWNMFWVTAVIVAFVGGAILATMSARSSYNSAQYAKEMTSDLFDPSFKVRYSDVGRSVIEAWYGGGQPPIDLTDSITWPSSIVSTTSKVSALPSSPVEDEEIPSVDQVTFLGGTSNEENSSYVEQLTYFALVQGVPYTVEVSIGVPDLVNDPNEAVLLSPPTIFPASTIMASSFNGIPDWDKAKVSDSMVSQLTAWAKAWTQDDRAVIKQMTQDPSVNSVFVGLAGGWRFVQNSLQVDWAVRVPNQSDTVIARVTWTIKVPDSETVVANEDGVRSNVTVVGPTQLQTMDVLIQKADTGLPAIVAWGPAGSGSSLTPYQDAVSAKDIDGTTGEVVEDEEPVVVESGEETASPTPTQSPSDEETPTESAQTEEGDQVE